MSYFYLGDDNMSKKKQSKKPTNSIATKQKKKQKFRASKEWKEFRNRIREKQINDPVTNTKLTRMANLHHCDMRDENYEDLSNEDNFVFLNQMTHKVIHFIYGKDWRKRILALENLCIKMEELNGGK